MEVGLQVSQQGALSTHEEAMAGHQHAMDFETELYVDDSLTLTRRESLWNVRGLTISEITLGDEELNVLRTCELLVRVYLLNCDGLEDLRVLAEMATLLEIHVDTRGPLQHVDSLTQLPALGELSLNCSNIGEKDVCQLDRIQSLEYISLSKRAEVIYERLPNYIRSTIITNNNLRDFCKDRDLVRINFSGCQNLTDVSPLADVQTLEDVNLSFCERLRDVGALGKLSRLRELNIGETCVDNAGLRGLRESQSLVKIYIAGCSDLTDVSPLADVQTLEDVAVFCCRNLKDVGALGRLPRLRELNAEGSGVDNAGLRGLRESQSLVKISFAGCSDVMDVSPLAEIQTLEELDFCFCDNVMDVGPLGRLPRLRELDLSETRIADAGLRGLCASQSLVKINIAGCYDVTDVSPLSHIENVIRYAH